MTTAQILEYRVDSYASFAASSDAAAQVRLWTVDLAFALPAAPRAPMPSDGARKSA